MNAATQNTGIRPVVLKELVDLAKQYGLCRLILFGSRARGDYHRASDIDLAVSGGDTVRFALAADEETSTLLQYDVVDLEELLNPDLKDSIAREGIVLYEKI